jgi:hypothetical protein
MIEPLVNKNLRDSEGSLNRNTTRKERHYKSICDSILNIAER